MTEQEFQNLCSKTSPGTTLTFSFRDQEVRGKFIGCAENAVVIEANGRGYFWPRDLCSYQESSYGIPSYSSNSESGIMSPDSHVIEYI